MTITLVLLIVAVILFAVAAVGIASDNPRFNLIAAGLAFFAASFLPLG